MLLAIVGERLYPSHRAATLLIVWLLLTLLPACSTGAAWAQPPDPPPLTLEDAVRQAVEVSPAVLAARSRVEASTAALRGARAPYNPQAELAPGVGFTNGNALLSQQFDVAGRRSAAARIAAGERAAAVAALGQARLLAAGDARLAYADLARSRALQATAEEGARIAWQLRDAVRKRVEIGEAPAVQATRAEIEVARAEQDVIRARGESVGRLATLNRLLGREPEGTLTLADGLSVPTAPGSAAELVAQAVNNRPELVEARALVEAQRGQVDLARSQRRPELFAELACDAWSLDRDPFRSRNFGLQARVSFPLFDRGRIRADVERARAGVREREAEQEALRRSLAVEVERAVAELNTAREVALNYQRTILSRTEELLQATRSGFEIGLTPFLEVLEAQRLVRQSRAEYLTALSDAARARVALDRALGSVPGLTPAAASPREVSR